MGWHKQRHKPAAAQTDQRWEDHECPVRRFITFSFSQIFCFSFFFPRGAVACQTKVELDINL